MKEKPSKSQEIIRRARHEQRRRPKVSVVREAMKQAKRRGSDKAR